MKVTPAAVAFIVCHFSFVARQQNQRKKATVARYAVTFQQEKEKNKEKKATLALPSPSSLHCNAARKINEEGDGNRC
jgi:hypothetical protein